MSSVLGAPTDVRKFTMEVVVVRRIYFRYVAQASRVREKLAYNDTISHFKISMGFFY